MGYCCQVARYVCSYVATAWDGPFNEFLFVLQGFYFKAKVYL